jgi:hypothetical protein
LELKPAYEDLLQVEHTSTEAYLKTLHETIVTTAIKVEYPNFTVVTVLVESHSVSLNVSQGHLV